jgi:streptomycin 6-kinase
VIVVPPSFVAHHPDLADWMASLPGLAERFLSEWELRPDGEPMHGFAGLVLPVVQADGVPAALKMPIRDEQTRGEADALRAWDGDGAVRLLRHDPDVWVMLLERLDSGRDLRTMADGEAALIVICKLLRRLHAYAPPDGLPTLAEVAAQMIEDAPVRAAQAGPDHGRRMRRWADETAEVATEPGDRLLHWDLHYENTLAGTREPWLAIDPKPLVGDACFDLWPALWNRWHEVQADPVRVVRRRFDVMVDELGLDRDRAVAWTRARMLQNAIWNVEDGEPAIDEIPLVIDDALG